MFEVKTDEFEGPLDTLLSLIKKRELPINEISLARVTDDYINYVAEHEESLENKAEFARIAATLVLAKSKSLLPEKEIEGEEEIEELEERLKAFKIIKERAENLAEQFTGASYAYPQSAKREQPIEFGPGETLTKNRLKKIAEKLIVSLPKESLPTANIADTVSIKDEINRLKDTSRKLGSFSLTSATRSNKKHHRVVSFIALLELIKEGELQATQDGTFGDIMIERYGQ